MRYALASVGTRRSRPLPQAGQEIHLPSVLIFSRFSRFVKSPTLRFPVPISFLLCKSLYCPYPSTQAGPSPLRLYRFAHAHPRPVGGNNSSPAVPGDPHRNAPGIYRLRLCPGSPIHSSGPADHPYSPFSIWASPPCVNGRKTLHIYKAYRKAPSSSCPPYRYVRTP